MKPLLAKLMRDWRVWTGFGSVAVLVAVAAFISRVAAFFIAGCGLLAGAVVGAIKWFGHRARSRKALEMEKGMLSMSSPPIGEGRASIQDLQRGFKESLDRLKNAPELGPDYLYRVPWYLIIGEPASGKTTTIRYSKLDLIGDKQQGVGGTLNCDWWFTNHGIILDTAGRYVFSEEGAPDRKEWEAFLSLVRRHRPRQPLNGVIMVIPVVRTKGTTDLPLLLPSAEADAERELLDRAARDAEKLYQKASQLPQRLGVRFPIYILVTKCDKVPGFQEFFTQAQMEYQTQLLGWSNPEVEAAYAQSMIDRAFETVGRSLERARLEILARETPLAFPDEVFVFPEEFKRLKEPLKAYMDVLFKRNIFQESLLFRGLYFTSGLQDRKPLEGLLGHSEAAAQPGGAPPGPVGESTIAISAAQAPLFESKPYFIRDFYSEKVFSESGLVRPTRARYQQAKRLTSILRAATLVIGVGGLVAFCFYLATLLSASRDLTEAVTPLKNEVVGLDEAKWSHLELVDDHASQVRGAVDAADRFDYPVLRLLAIDLPTRRVREDSFAALDVLILRLLSEKFLGEFPAKIRKELERKDLVKPVLNLSDSELVRVLIPNWKKEAGMYLQAVQEENLDTRNRMSLLWTVAAGKTEQPQSLIGLINEYWDSEDLKEHLGSLPPLERDLPGVREFLMKRLKDLDLTVDLPVEAAVKLLQEMAGKIGILGKEDAPFDERLSALKTLMVGLDRLPKELLTPLGDLRPIEAHFERDFAERAKQMDKILNDTVPLTESRTSKLGSLVEKAGKLAGVGKDGEDSDAWKASERWKKFQQLIQSEGLKVAGIGPAGDQEALLLRKAPVPAEDGTPVAKVLFALSTEGHEFFREIQFLKDQKELRVTGGDGADLPQDADEKIQDAIELLLSEDFVADERHLTLIQRVQKLLESEKALQGTPSATGPKPPATPSLIRVVKELVKREVEESLYQALIVAPPPPPETERWSFGSDQEGEFLTRIESSTWLPAGTPERDRVERIQIKHALNRLKIQRKLLTDGSIFSIQENAVRAWDFAPKAEGVNLNLLFGTSASVFNTYFDQQIRSLRIEYVNRLKKVECLKLLEGDGRIAESEKQDFDFWKETLSEASQETGTKEPSTRRDQIRDLIQKVLRISTSDRVLYKSLTDFIDSEEAVKGQHDRTKSFLDLRYVAISEAVTGRIRRFLAEQFSSEFGVFAPKIHRALKGRFPVSFDLAAKDNPYLPLNQELQDADNFYQRWGLGEVAGDADRRKLANYITDEFQKDYGVDLAEAYRNLLDFVRGNFFQGAYQVRVRILNRDPAFKSALDGEGRQALDEANRVLREFWLRAGDTEQKLDPEESVEIRWVNPQGMALRVRLTAYEDRFKIKGPKDEKADQEATYQYAGGTDHHWSLFKMILDQTYRLDPGKNVLKFDFEVVPPITLEGREIKSIPLFVSLEFQQATGAPAGGAAYKQFNYKDLAELYGKLSDPILRFPGSR